MLQNKLKDDISCGVGKNSWYVQRPLAKCKGLFENVVNEFIVHAFACKCGYCQIYINRQVSMNHICNKCSCNYFYTPRYFINTSNTILVNITINPVLETTIAGYSASLFLDIPFDIDINSTKLIYKKKKILTIMIDNNGNKSLDSKYMLTSYAQEKIDKIFTKYIFISIKKYLKNDEILNFLQMSIKEQYEVISFFLKYPTILDAEFYFWERNFCKELIDFYKEHTTPLEALKHISNHKKKTVLRALFTRYSYEIKKRKFDPFFPFIICRVFDDINIITVLLKDTSLLFYNNNYSIQEYKINKILSFFNFLKKYYSKFEIVKFIKDMSTYMILFEDIYNMYDSINPSFDKYFTKVKISLINIHNEFVKINHIHHVSSSYNFTYTEQYTKACVIKNSLDYRLPKSGKELSSWSIKLRNCLFSYSDKIEKKDAVIYGVFKNNEIHYAIEISNQRIIQALGSLNQSINQVDRNYIEEWFDKYISQDIDKKM